MERMIDQDTLLWLAELVDRPPTADEQARLDAHPGLAAELAALKGQSEALSGLPRMQPPRGDWAMLEARLMSEGLIHTRKNHWLALPLSSGWTRTAAAAALFIAGAATGVSFPSDGTPSAGVTTADLAAIETVDQAEQVVQAAEQQYMNSLLRVPTATAGVQRVVAKRTVSKPGARPLGTGRRKRPASSARRSVHQRLPPQYPRRPRGRGPQRRHTGQLVLRMNVGKRIGWVATRDRGVGTGIRPGSRVSQAELCGPHGRGAGRRSWSGRRTLPVTA